MKYLVFGGSGAIGRAITWDLARDAEVDRVGIVGRREESLLRVKEWADSEIISPHPLDIHDRGATQRLMNRYDVGLVALPNRKASYNLIQTAVESGFSLVDILEEYHRKPDIYETEGLELPQGMSLSDYGDWLHEEADKNGVTILDGMGFAPGLSNVTTADGIRKLDKAETAVARVGGIPSKETSLKHPLRYMITWAFEHVLREYMVKLNVIKDGQIKEVEAMSDQERFRFRRFGQDEELVCAVTPGMPSFVYTRPQLREFTEKTIRWPGHWEGIEVLKEIGLLDLAMVEYQGAEISPRDFMLSILKPKLKPQEGDIDVCVMWNSVTGIKNGQKTRVDYYLWDEADPKTGLSAMARVTGFSEAICARYLAKGKVKAKGIVPPEDGITEELYEDFIAALKQRNIEVLEEVFLES